MEKLAVNVRVPFCRGNCVHCDGVRCGQNVGYLHRYRRALEREIAAAAEELAGYQIGCVHIQGDAFQLLGPGALDDMLKGLRRLLPGQPDTQWVADVMPDELSEEFLHVMLKRNGLDRLQLQLFTDDARQLRALHGPCTANIIQGALKRLGDKPLACLDLVLAAGIPGQGEAELGDTLVRALQIRPQQVSVLRFHDNRLDAARQRAYAEETDWGAYLAVLTQTLQAAGYLRAGTSWTFALPGRLRVECTQQARKWPVMGFGLGAYTAMEGMAYHNTTDYALYVEHAGELEKIAVLDE